MRKTESFNVLCPLLNTAFSPSPAIDCSTENTPVVKLPSLVSNAPRRRSRRSKSRSSLPNSQSSKSVLSAPHQLLWALIGLLLTIGGTFLEAFITTFPWQWADRGIQAHSLGVTYQIGAVLLVGCLGGKNAAALSQIAYIALGLTFFPIFSQGGGLAYLREPTFGYLLGFIPGAWLCGWLAFRHRAKLESLAFSGISGLFAIHSIGIAYLMGLQLFSPLGNGFSAFFQGIVKYSIFPLPGQIAIVCAVSVLGFILRQILFY